MCNAFKTQNHKWLGQKFKKNHSSTKQIQISILNIIKANKAWIHTMQASFKLKQSSSPFYENDFLQQNITNFSNQSSSDSFSFIEFHSCNQTGSFVHAHKPQVLDYSHYYSCRQIRKIQKLTKLYFIDYYFFVTLWCQE